MDSMDFDKTNYHYIYHKLPRSNEHIFWTFSNSVEKEDRFSLFFIKFLV